MISEHFPAGLRDPLKHFTGMHKGIDADLIASLSVHFSILSSSLLLFQPHPRLGLSPSTPPSPLTPVIELISVRTPPTPCSCHLSPRTLCRSERSDLYLRYPIEYGIESFSRHYTFGH